jgi:hypothetical protein
MRGWCIKEPVVCQYGISKATKEPCDNSDTPRQGGETTKRISVDEGDAYMSICSCCFKRFIKRKVEGNWFGWFDCDYPPQARVVGSKWYYDNVVSQKVRALPTPPSASEASEEEAPEEAAPEEAAPEEAAPEAEVEELQKGLEKMSISEKPTKEELKKKIKEIQKNAKPGKMSLKEIQAAFKEITNLRSQIHML